MLLSDAIAEFQSLFASVVVREKQQEDKDVPVTWSGGQRKSSETSAALYATKDLALEAWLNTAKSYASVFNFVEVSGSGKSRTQKSAVLEWVLKPELLEYQITIADRFGQHRLVNNRFAVKSQFVVKTDGKE